MSDQKNEPIALPQGDLAETASLAASDAPTEAEPDLQKAPPPGAPRQSKWSSARRELPGSAGGEDDLQKFISELDSMAKSTNRYSSEYQLHRLLNESFLNPYDILELGPEANEEEIKKQFKSISILVHPDKCRHDRAADAFHLIEQAYKTLRDPDKRKIYQRVMREARERVEYERDTENKRRKKLGMGPLSNDNFNFDVQNMCKKLFEEIEERKKHFERIELCQKKRMRDEQERRKII